MKKVAFIVTGLGSGGIENYLFRFIKFSKYDIIPTVICTRKAEGALAREFRELNINIITQKISYFNLIHLIKLYRLLKINKYDTICDFSGDFSALTLLVSRIAGINNRIAFYRNSKYQFIINHAKWLYVKVLKSILKLSKPKIFSNSEHALNVFHPNWKKNTKTVYKIIHNGVPFKVLPENNKSQILKSTLNIPDNCYVIGHVGNFRKAKNHNAIINIAKQIIPEIENVRFLLVGEELQEGLYTTLRKDSIEQYFILPGIRKDIPELLNLMDVFLFPSTDEGQPNALIEAMLYEVPVFASNIPTILECTPNEVIGNVFQPNDCKAFSNAIITFFKTRKTYNLKKVSEWTKMKFNPEVRFKEFLDELI